MALKLNPATNELEDDGTGIAPTPGLGLRQNLTGTVTATPPATPAPAIPATPATSVPTPVVTGPPKLEVTGITSGTEGVVVSKEHKAALKEAEAADKDLADAAVKKGTADVALQDQAAKDAEAAANRKAAQEKARIAAEAEHQRKIAAAEAEEQRRKEEMISKGKITDYWADKGAGKRVLSEIVGAMSEIGHILDGGTPGQSLWTRTMEAEQAKDAATKQAEFLRSEKFYEISKQGTAAAKAAWHDFQAKLKTDADAQDAIAAAFATARAEKLKTPQAQAVAAEAVARARQNAADRAGQRGALFDRKFSGSTTKTAPAGPEQLPLARPEDIKTKEELTKEEADLAEIKGALKRNPGYVALLQEAAKQSSLVEAGKKVGGAIPGVSSIVHGGATLLGVETPEKQLRKVAKDNGANPDIAAKLYEIVQNRKLNVSGMTPEGLIREINEAHEQTKNTLTGIKAVKRFPEAAAIGAPAPIRLTDQGKRALAGLNVRRKDGTITQKDIESARAAGVPEDVLALYAPTTNLAAGFR
jgi:hypothetical protein